MSAPRPKTKADWAYLSIEALDGYLTQVKKNGDAEQAILLDLATIAKSMVDQAGIEGAKKLLDETMKDVKQRLEPRFWPRFEAPAQWFSQVS